MRSAFFAIAICSLLAAFQAHARAAPRPDGTNKVGADPQNNNGAAVADPVTTQDPSARSMPLPGPNQPATGSVFPEATNTPGAPGTIQQPVATPNRNPSAEQAPAAQNTPGLPPATTPSYTPPTTPPPPTTNAVPQAIPPPTPPSTAQPLTPQEREQRE
jgi:hypothetical protein